MLADLVPGKGPPTGLQITALLCSQMMGEEREHEQNIKRERGREGGGERMPVNSGLFSSS